MKILKGLLRRSPREDSQKPERQSRLEVLLTWEGMLGSADREIDEVVLPSKLEEAYKSKYLPRDLRERLLDAESILDDIRNWMWSEIEKEYEKEEQEDL